MKKSAQIGVAGLSGLHTRQIVARIGCTDLRMEVESEADCSGHRMELHIERSGELEVMQEQTDAAEGKVSLLFGPVRRLRLHGMAAAALSTDCELVFSVAGGGAEYTTRRLEKPDEGDAATYELLKNGTPVGERIHIPLSSNVAVDEELNDKSKNAVANAAVKAEFDRIATVYGAQLRLNKETLDIGPGYSLSLLDSEGTELSTTEPFTGGGGAAVTMIVTRRKSTVLSQFGSSALLELSFTSRTAAGSTGNGQVAWYADALNTSPIRSQDIEQSADADDYSVKLDVAPWITSTGARTFYALVTDSQENTRTVSFNVETITFKVENRYPLNSAAPLGRDIDYRYALDGGGSNVKYIHFTLDGVQLTTDTITTTDNDNISKIISTEGLTHGAHRLTVQGEIRDEAGEAIFSNTETVDLIVADPAATQPIISLHRAAAAGSEQAAKVYQTLRTDVVVYVPGATADNQVELRASGAAVTYVRLENLVVFTWNYTVEALTPALILSAACGGTERALPPIAVTERVVDVDEAEIGLALKLAARGRTNSAPDRNVWAYASELYGSYAAKFSDNFNWSSDGWLKDAEGVTMLHMTNGARVDIPFYLFRPDNTDPTASTNYIVHNYGRTIEIEFRISNALAYDVKAIACWSGDIGFYITPTKIYFQNSAGASAALTTDFLEGDRVRMGLVFQSTASGRGMFLYLNGKQTGYFTYDDTHSFQQAAPVGIVVDSALCDVDLYRVLVYNSALTKTQMVGNYIVGLDAVARMVEVYNRNDIFYNSLISAAKAQAYIPVMIFTGAGIEAYMNVPVANKSMKIDVGVEYIDTADPARSFTASGVQVKFQGTSSMAYPVRNFKIKTAKGAIEGNEEFATPAAGLYKLRPESYPVNTWCLKADFAESSGTHNTGAAKLINDVLTAATDGSGNKVYLTPPQRGNTGKFDIRTTVDGFPILLFRRERVSDTPFFVGKYNFNNDKSTQGVFGFEQVPGFNDQLLNRTQITAAEDDYRLSDGSLNPASRVNPCECWEFCSNDVDLCKFKYASEEEMDTPTMQMAFESRYPEVYGDDTDYATSPWGYHELKKVLRWVHATDTSAVSEVNPEPLAEAVTYGGVTYDHDTREYRLAKFRAEVAEHFNLDNLLAYYVLTDFLGAVDQRAKNQMMASWGNEGGGDFKWYFIFYDNDTILGLNNSGLIKYDYDLEADTPNAYSGKDSVLWVNIAACFKEELSVCWQRLAKAAKNSQNILSYESLIRYFNTEQSDKWAESVFNEDSYNKYVKQGGSEVPNVKYYPVLQGSREHHRRYWLANRLEWINGKYAAESFVSKTCYWRSNRGPDCDMRFVITGDRKQYYGYMIGTAWKEVFFLDAGASHEVHYTGGWDYSDTYVFGYSHITDLGDMSPMYPSEMVISQLARLRRLVVSTPEHRNTFLTVLDLQNKPYLDYLDIRHAANLSAISNLEACPKLRVMRAEGSGLRNVRFADGGLLEEVFLPATVTSLDMRNLSKITMARFGFEGLKNIVDLYIDNCPKFPVLSILDQIAGNPGLNSVYLLNIARGNFSYLQDTIANLLSLHENPAIDTRFTGQIFAARIGNLQLGLVERIEGLEVTYREMVEDVTIEVSGYHDLDEGEWFLMTASVSGTTHPVNFVWEVLSGQENVSVDENGHVSTEARWENRDYTETVRIRVSLAESKYVYSDISFQLRGFALTGVEVVINQDLSTAGGLPAFFPIDYRFLPRETTKVPILRYFVFSKPADAPNADLYHVQNTELTVAGNKNGREFDIVIQTEASVAGSVITSRTTLVCDEVHVGNFVYADGSSSVAYIPSKPLVGVCFYISEDKTDRRMIAAKNGYKKAVIWGEGISLDSTDIPANRCLWLHELLNIDATLASMTVVPDNAIRATTCSNSWQGLFSGKPQDYRKTPVGSWPKGESDRKFNRCCSLWGAMEGRQETDAMLYFREQNGYTQLTSEADIDITDERQYPAAALATLYGDTGAVVGKRGSWYLPSSGELTQIYMNLRYDSTVFAKLQALPADVFDSIASLNAQCSSVGHNGYHQIYLNFANGELGSAWSARKAVARTLRFVTTF